MAEKVERISIKAHLTNKQDQDNWAELKEHYQENYGSQISDSEIIKRIIEREANRTKSKSRNATINQTWWLVFDLWAKITGNELTVKEVQDMIESDMGRSMHQ